MLTGGGPGDATHVVVMTIYQAAFQNLQIGYGSAVATLLFAVIMVDFFDTLGVSMHLGRTFLREEDRPDRRYVVILSHGLWVRRFGGPRSRRVRDWSPHTVQYCGWR